MDDDLPLPLRREVRPLLRQDQQKSPRSERTLKSPLFSPYSCRLYIALLLMGAMLCSSLMRVNFNMAVVCMVRPRQQNQTSSSSTQTTQNLTEVCMADNGNKTLEAGGYRGTIDWTAQQQSYLFAAPPLGSLLTMLPAGYCADRYGPKWQLVISVSVYSICAMLSPISTLWHYNAFLGCRFVLGMAEGLMMPSIATMIYRWFPAGERSTVSGLYTSGVQLANVITTLTVPRLCRSDFLGGWPAIFYLSGSTGILWLFVWVCFSTNNPLEHQCISVTEQRFLLRETTPRKSLSTENYIVPWRHMLTSMPVYANYVAMFIAYFGVVLVNIYTPAYNRDVLMLDIVTNGYFNAISFGIQLIAKLAVGGIADFVRQRGIISSTGAVRFFQAFATFGNGGVLLCLAYFVDCTRPALALFLAMLFGIMNVGNVPGVLTSTLSIAPANTGVLSATAQFFGMIGWALSPIFVGLLNVHGTPDEWVIIFTATALLYGSGGIFYMLFSSGDQQNWEPQRTEVVVIEVAQTKRRPSSPIRHLSMVSILSSDNCRRYSVDV